MMYSYVVSKTLNFPLRSRGTKARLAAGEPCEGEKTHTPQPPKFWGPGKAENWQRLLALSRLHPRLLLSPAWPPSGCPSLDSTPRLLPVPDSTLHAEGLVQGAESREACRPWVACSLHLPHSWWATSSASHVCLLLGPHSGHRVSHIGSVHGDHSLLAAPASPWLANLSGSPFQAHCS